MYRVPSRTTLSRRSFVAGTTALLISTGISPALARTPEDFVADLWPAAKSRGVSSAAFKSALKDFAPLSKVMELSRKQPEFTSTVADYIGKRVNDKRIATGEGMRGEWAKTLAAVEQNYGVQAEILLAIWGIETDFGGFMGGTNTAHALATLTYGGYRSDYFGEELLTALKIITDGHISAGEMVGSWAGAMGHPQFMPSSFTRFAVDFRGEGRADIWNSVPDALASAANYLKAHGWRPGETWGYEVKLPQNFDYRYVWSETTAKLGDWAAAGVMRVSGKPFPREDDIGRLYLPMGGYGPVFLVLPNFGVIKRYNNSDSYALAVGHLADRILGARGFAAAWPKDTNLDPDQKIQVQKLLLKHGYDIGSADGVIGPKTRAAAMQFQSAAGLLPDGHISGRLLAALS
jgi:membrane-bound lytic murein transglycosylase B